MNIRRSVAENENNPLETGAKTILSAILTGIGLGIGFYLVNKTAKEKRGT